MIFARLARYLMAASAAQFLDRRQFGHWLDYYSEVGIATVTAGRFGTSTGPRAFIVPNRFRDGDLPGPMAEWSS